MTPSDPAVNDRDRRGDDLLARIAELTTGPNAHRATAPCGWGPLLCAAAAEIGRLRAAERRRAAGLARTAGAMELADAIEGEGR